MLIDVAGVNFTRPDGMWSYFTAGNALKINYASWVSSNRKNKPKEKEKAHEAISYIPAG